MEALRNIQANLKAPKGQTNTFGKYNYRSCEDILTALKPLLKEHNSLLTISDEILLIGDRYYVKATAKISCGEAQESVSAYARESLDKKGMDVAQITGAASSYARKYALNGLFAIDDTKDPDSFDNKTGTKETKTLPSLTPQNGKAWNRAIAKYKEDGNFKAIEEFMTIAEDHKTMIKDAAKEDA